MYKIKLYLNYYINLLLEFVFSILTGYFYWSLPLKCLIGRCYYPAVSTFYFVIKPWARLGVFTSIHTGNFAVIFQPPFSFSSNCFTPRGIYHWGRLTYMVQNLFNMRCTLHLPINYQLKTLYNPIINIQLYFILLKLFNNLN